MMGEVAEGVGVLQLQVGALVGGGACDEVVEHVEIALADDGVGDPRLLEIVLEALDTDEAPLVGELQLGVASEA